MVGTVKAGAKLERAFVEGMVIQSGLDHLAARLDTADSQLKEDLRVCTEQFDAYMRELHEACERADLQPARK
jgi:hypothetical protein